MDIHSPEYIDKKAARLRTALLADGVTVSPTPQVPFEDLPIERKNRWRDLAVAYINIFCR